MRHVIHLNNFNLHCLCLDRTELHPSLRYYLSCLTGEVSIKSPSFSYWHISIRLLVCEWKSLYLNTYLPTLCDPVLTICDLKFDPIHPPSEANIPRLGTDLLAQSHFIDDKPSLLAIEYIFSDNLVVTAPEGGAGQFSFPLISSLTKRLSTNNFLLFFYG